MPVDLTLPRIMPLGTMPSLPQLPQLPQVAPASVAANAAAASAADGSLIQAPLAVGATGETALAGTSSAKGVVGSFAELLSQALQDVNAVQQAADAGAAQVAAGEPVDVHTVMIGMEKANLAFGLTLQVRNKLLEAYQEVMRMTV